MDLSYDGTNYHGWQNQPNAISVQSCIEKALSLLVRVDTPIYAAGSAIDGYIVQLPLPSHIDSQKILNIPKLVHDLNSFLAKDISINNIFRVNNDSHARFDAVSREYEYKISLHKDVFNINKSYYVYHNLDIKLMNDACTTLKNHVNFKCFSRSKTDVKTYNCDLILAKWEFNNDLLVFTIRADRFLRNMVRAIVGTMILVGNKKINLKDLEEILISQDRTKAGPSAPAHALYLSNIEYSKEIFANE